MIGIPRQIYTSLFRFILVSLLSVFLLTGSTFLIAILLAWLQNNSWDRPAHLITGLSCGLIAWLFIAIFHLRHETHSLPIAQRELFLAEAKTILQDLGYALVSQLPDDLTFRPRFHAFLFGGSIRLVIEGRRAKLSGPKVALEIFRRLYRLQHHVQRVQHMLHEHRQFTENLLKRVELRLRLQPEQFEKVAKNVVAVLQQDGEVICELNLLVQCTNGIRENIVEFQIREWLQQQSIVCDIHKDLVQFVEVVHTEEALTAVSA